MPDTETPHIKIPHPSSQERIVAAAVSVYGVVLTLPPPARHHTILKALTDLNPSLRPGPRGQGFITSTGRYVGRIEAAVIAGRAEQFLKLSDPPELYSEDLW